MFYNFKFQIQNRFFNSIIQYKPNIQRLVVAYTNTYICPYICRFVIKYTPCLSFRKQMWIWQRNNNNNNSYKTYMVLISSKRFDLVGASSSGVGQTRISGKMQSSKVHQKWSDGKEKHKKDKQVCKCEFSNGDRKKVCYLMT